ncbi:MAG: DUF4124 domain-containing protein [Marinobacter sp.]|uniref:DUF4124 domain-containing protein n=1 Tax=Marinobacter sp. TaxID=50741 RepID=UPI00349FD80D
MNNGKWTLPLLIALFTLFTLSAFPATAEVYKHVDKNGNVTFSDEPQSGSEEVKVRPVTTITLPKMRDIEAQQQRAKQTEQDNPEPYDRVAFTTPENNAAFWSGGGDVEFQVSSSPGLRQGHRFEVDLDGQPVGQNPGGTFTVRNMDRGTHNASVFVVDAQGQRVQSGNSITFTVHRPSVINRNRNN